MPRHEVQPFEARKLPELPDDPTLTAAMMDVATAVSGFAYAGTSTETIVLMTRWLNAHPEYMDDLFPLWSQFQNTVDAVVRISKKINELDLDEDVRVAVQSIIEEEVTL